MASIPSRRAAMVFASADGIAAAVIALGVFRGLPARYAPVDVPAGILVVLLAASGGGLAVRAPWSLAVARITAAAALVAGLLLVSLLAVTASWLAGVYGAVGSGGALLLWLVLALALPYLVALPAAQLALLAPEKAEKT